MPYTRGPYRKRDLMDRVDKFIIPEPNSGCWLWLGGTVSNGYGKVGVRVNNKQHTRVAHLVIYEHLVGKVPNGLELDHKCRTKLCVNPDHLEPVTHLENQRRGTSPVAVAMAKTHCVRGHELSGENLYMTPDGRRQCRVCICVRAKRWRNRQRIIGGQ